MSAPGDVAGGDAFFHVTANNCVMHGATLSGGKLVLMYKWDTEEALKLIEREQVNTLSAVPMMTRELLAHPTLVITTLPVWRRSAVVARRCILISRVR